MTYQDDPNSPNIRRTTRPQEDPKSYVSWIIGAAVMIALVFGAYTFFNRNNTNTASNNNTPAASSQSTAITPMRPATTGSGAGTSTTPAPSTPAAPAR